MDSEDIIKSIKEIYNNLQDEVSKRIYTNRLLFNLTEDDKYIRILFDEWKWKDRLISDVESFKSRICVYGAGDFGKRFVRYFPELNWECFVDKNAIDIDKVGNFKVCTVEEYLEKELPIIISVKRNYTTIKNILISRGIPEKNILCLHDYLCEMNHIYFDILSPKEDEVFADVGGYDGMNSFF